MDKYTATEIAYKNGYKAGYEAGLTDTDAVEVVRCKDCKHYANYGRVWDCRKYGCMSLPNENDFCSYGERREGE